MNNDLLHEIAITLVPNIGAVQAKILLDHFGSATKIFTAKNSMLSKLDGIGEIRAANIKLFKDFKKAEAEQLFIEKYKIKALFLTNPLYPKRLLNVYDPPTMLYYRGNADLNAAHMVAIVGTRGKTPYGTLVTEQLVAGLQAHNVTIVSGLALGIDAVAHKAAIQHHLPTIGVVAHGLDKIYPSEHLHLAKDIVRQEGGLLTEFRSKTKPDKHNFPSRNRVVAGMTDATIVIETDIKGGSLITADIANSYNKDVFAVPGRLGDSKSSGCNYLIKNNKAQLLTSAEDLVECLGWQQTKPLARKPQRELFIQLSDEERTIVEILKQQAFVAIDELNAKSKLSTSTVAAAILNLELQNVVASLPGKRFKLIS